MFGSYTPLSYFFLALGVAAFVVEAWAFIDCITRPSQAFVASGKRTKQLWLIITGVAAVVGLGGALLGMGPVSILPVAAFVAAAVYLTTPWVFRLAALPYAVRCADCAGRR